MFSPCIKGHPKSNLKKIKSVQSIVPKNTSGYVQRHQNRRTQTENLSFSSKESPNEYINSLEKKMSLNLSLSKIETLPISFSSQWQQIEQKMRRNQKMEVQTSDGSKHFFEHKFQEDNSSTEQSSLQQIDYVNSEYQLNSSNIFSKPKQVQFSEKLIQPETKRQTFIQKRSELRKDGKKVPSILKNTSRVLDQSLYSESQKSYSVENSFTAHRKSKNNLAGQKYSGNEATKERYLKILQRLQSKANPFVHLQPQKSSKILHKSNYEFLDDRFDGKQMNRTNLMTGQLQAGEKFKDDIFPPVYSSLFRIISTKGKPSVNGSRGKQIEWIRLSELFRGRKVRIYNNSIERNSQIKIFKSEFEGKSYYQSDMLVGAFNAIKNNRVLLSNIFQNQEDLNSFGIYLLKIHVDNIWKYLIVDDFIPVIGTGDFNRRNSSKQQFDSFGKDDRKYVPAFLNVQLNQTWNRNYQTLYLWPFLLQKAYASYYSCYDTLNYGNIIDFVSELSGVPYEVMKFPNSTKEQNSADLANKIKKFSCLMKQKTTVALGYSDEELPYVPLHYDSSLQHNTQILPSTEVLSNDDPLNSYERFQVSFDEAVSLFSRIYFLNTNRFEFTSICQVYPLKIKEDKTKILVQDKVIQDSVSLRIFTIKKPTKGWLSIIQKENRYFMKKQSVYLWVRAILLCKDYDGGYQWVDGKYSNKKSISFSINLDCGQYYLIIMPEWRQSHNRQLAVVLNSDNELIEFERKMFDSSEKIIQSGCMDLAQKRGQLSQINKFICSYTYVLERAALIVENICNERPKGQITIMRSINGLKAKYMIIPVNQEFYLSFESTEHVQTDLGQGLVYLPTETNPYNRRLKNDIEIEIPSLQTYTVVLKMIGGVDRKFFKAFSFG